MQLNYWEWRKLTDAIETATTVEELKAIVLELVNGIYSQSEHDSDYD